MTLRTPTILSAALLLGAFAAAAGLSTCRGMRAPSATAPAAREPLAPPPQAGAQPSPISPTATTAASPATAASSDPARRLRYDFDRPLRAFSLPDGLREISAATGVDDRTIACLQDEKGILFFVDVIDGRLRRALAFGPDGDYEGLARVGSDYYVLRSDGWLARVTPRGNGMVVAESFMVTTPNHNLEGLCHDEARHALILAPKDFLKPPRGEQKGDADTKKKRKGAPATETEGAPTRRELRDQRVLFGWDLRQRALLDAPVLRISVDDLRRQARARGDELPTRTNKRGDERSMLRLMFSCVAVAPSQDDIYCLSAVDQVLVVLDRRGDLRELHCLDASVLPKPEGLTFLSNGDLVVSSEGVDGPARIVVYRGE